MSMIDCAVAVHTNGRAPWLYRSINSLIRCDNFVTFRYEPRLIVRRMMIPNS